LGELRNAYGEAGRYWDPIYGGNLEGFLSYGDALGLGGPTGYERARTAFRTSPGYQYALDEGLNAVLRNASRLGNIGSGNTLTALQSRGQALADQEWGNYIARLAPYLAGAQTATAGRAGVTTDLGKQLNTNQLYKGGIGFQTEAGIGNANADAAMADTVASGNLWRALMGGTNAAAKLWGG
jgi:hypothetical protein